MVENILFRRYESLCVSSLFKVTYFIIWRNGNNFHYNNIYIIVKFKPNLLMNSIKIYLSLIVRGFYI